MQDQREDEGRDGPNKDGGKEKGGRENDRKTGIERIRRGASIG